MRIFRVMRILCVMRFKRMVDRVMRIVRMVDRVMRIVRMT